MTILQEQSMNLVKRLPDDKVYYLVNLLEGLVESKQTEENTLIQSKKAYQNLQKFRRKGIVERNYKAKYITNKRYL